jgi:hypothetical protein
MAYEISGLASLNSKTGCSQVKLSQPRRDANKRKYAPFVFIGVYSRFLRSLRWNLANPPVRAWLDYIEGGDTLAEFLEPYPTVSRTQAVGFLEAASECLLAAA